MVEVLCKLRRKGGKEQALPKSAVLRHALKNDSSLRFVNKPTK